MYSEDLKLRNSYVTGQADSRVGVREMFPEAPGTPHFSVVDAGDEKVRSMHWTLRVQESLTGLPYVVAVFWLYVLELLDCTWFFWHTSRKSSTGKTLCICKASFSHLLALHGVHTE